MSKPLIRFARRLSSWEARTRDDDLLRIEFWDRDRAEPDLRPSVYEVAPDDIVQAFAEHATAFDPPASTVGADLGGTGRPVERTLGDTGFRFTMEAHREVVLRNRDDLLALIRQVRGSLATRTHRISRVQVREYARSRLAGGDVEWETNRAQPGAQRWLAKIAV